MAFEEDRPPERGLTEQRGALARERLPRDGWQGRRRRPSWDAVGVWHLPSAAAFSSDSSLCDPLLVIEEFRRHDFSAALRVLTDTSPTSLGSQSVDGGRKLGR